MENNSNDNIDNFDLNSVRVTRFVFFLHYSALIVKRLIYMKRDIRGMLCEIFLPSIIIILGLALQTVVEDT